MSWGPVWSRTGVVVDAAEILRVGKKGRKKIHRGVDGVTEEYCNDNMKPIHVVSNYPNRSEGSIAVITVTRWSSADYKPSRKKKTFGKILSSQNNECLDWSDVQSVMNFVRNIESRAWNQSRISCKNRASVSRREMRGVPNGWHPIIQFLVVMFLLGRRRRIHVKFESVEANLSRFSGTRFQFDDRRIRIECEQTVRVISFLFDWTRGFFCLVGVEGYTSNLDHWKQIWLLLRFFETRFQFDDGENRRKCERNCQFQQFISHSVGRGVSSTIGTKKWGYDGRLVLTLRKTRRERGIGWRDHFDFVFSIFRSTDYLRKEIKKPNCRPSSLFQAFYIHSISKARLFT